MQPTFLILQVVWSIYTNAGVLASLALLAACLSNPALMALPYLMVLCGASWRWSEWGHEGLGNGALRLLQGYAAVHYTLLYVWQVGAEWGSCAWEMAISLPLKSPPLLPLQHCRSLSAVRQAGVTEIMNGTPHTCSPTHPFPHGLDVQVPLVRLSILRPAAHAVGLFVLSTDAPPAELLPQLVQFGSAMALFAALAFCEGSSYQPFGARQLSLLARVLNMGEGVVPHTHRHARQQQQRQPGEDEGLLEVQQPLLPYEAQQAQQVQHGSTGRRPRWWMVLLPMLFELLVTATRVLCSRPGAVAAMLCTLSLIQPSIIGFSVLVTGVGTLLYTLGGVGPNPLTRANKVVAVLLLTWLAACYCATALHGVAYVGPTAEAVGLHAFALNGLEFAPLAAILFAAAAVAGLSYHPAATLRDR
jgi:hypothetical protein